MVAGLRSQRAYSHGMNAVNNVENVLMMFVSQNWLKIKSSLKSINSVRTVNESIKSKIYHEIQIFFSGTSFLFFFFLALSFFIAKSIFRLHYARRINNIPFYSYSMVDRMKIYTAEQIPIIWLWLWLWFCAIFFFLYPILFSVILC